MAKDKETRSDATLKNLAEKNPEVEEALWRFRYPEEGGTKLPFEEILVEIPLRYGIVVKSLSTLSDYYAWAKLRRRMAAARDTADQTRLALLKDASLKPEEIERVAQTVFTAETFEAGNVNAYVALCRLRLEASRQQLEREKITAAGKSKIEAGLDALLAEIQGNPKALKLFNDLKEVVSKA